MQYALPLLKERTSLLPNVFLILRLSASVSGDALRTTRIVADLEEEGPIISPLRDDGTKFWKVSSDSVKWQILTFEIQIPTLSIIRGL